MNFLNLKFFLIFTSYAIKMQDREPKTQLKGLWLTWGVATVLSAVLAGLSLTTFANLLHAKRQTAADSYDSDALDGTLTACFLSAFSSLIVTAVAFLILIKKSIVSAQAPTLGFGYAFICASYLHSAILFILAGMTLLATRQSTSAFQNESAWSSTDSAVLSTTMVFAFATAGVYLGVFISLLVLKKAVHSLPMIEPDQHRRLRSQGSLSSQQLPTETELTTPPRDRLESSRQIIVDTPSDWKESVDAARKKSSYGAWGV